jgi:hypothetical protein
VGGRSEPKALPCRRFPQRYGLTLSGVWTRCECRHRNVPTTASGCAFILIFATSTATPWAPPLATVLSWRSSPRRTSPWPSEAKLRLRSGCCSNQPRREVPNTLRLQRPPRPTRPRSSTANRLSLVATATQHCARGREFPRLQPRPRGRSRKRVRLRHHGTGRRDRHAASTSGSLRKPEAVASRPSWYALSSNYQCPPN